MDTSVWVEHLRRGEPRLRSLLQSGQVVTHPLVIGELACGRMANRQEILALLHALTLATIATHEEVLHLIEQHTLCGKGLGIVDAHLLASCRLQRIPLWTRDARLEQAAQNLDVAWR